MGLNKYERKIKRKFQLLYVLLGLTVVTNLFIPVTKGTLWYLVICQLILMGAYIKSFMGFLSYGNRTIPYTSVLVFRVLELVLALRVGQLHLIGYLSLLLFDLFNIVYMTSFRSSLMFVVDSATEGEIEHVEED